MKYISIILLSVCALANSYSQNKAGFLDNSFGSNGTVITTLKNGSWDCVDAVTQHDGRIVCVGSGGYNDSIGGFAAARYLPNGSFDSSFGQNGLSFIYFDSISQFANAGCVQADDKILVAGYGANGMFDPTYYMLVCRFNADGSPDLTFGDNGKFMSDEGNDAHDIIVQDDGKIIVIGNNGVGTVLLRLLPDGTPDKSFGSGGVVNTELASSTAHSGVILKDGKILIGGDNYDHLIFTRYNSNGSLDLSFGTNGIVYSTPNSHNFGQADLFLNKDGSFFSAVNISLFVSDTAAVIKYTPEGKIDSSFGVEGIAQQKLKYSSIAKKIKLQGDGKIILAGGTGGGFETYQHFLLERFTNDGDIDSTFGNFGHQITELENSETGNAVILQSTGRIVLAGSTINNKIKPSIHSFALLGYTNDINKKKIIITKIRKWIQHHNSIVWNNEVGAKIYSVQRSADQVHWVILKSFQSDNLVSENYFEDNSPANNINYYRVTTVSNDGISANSNIISDVDESSDIKLFPNPAKNNVYITGLKVNQRNEISVVDLSGNVRLHTTSSSDRYSLNISSLPSGNYTIKIQSGQNNISQNLLKE